MAAEIIDRCDLPSLGDRLRGEGKKIAFANGCFDLLHVGHIRYLLGARAAADCLIVGINSDESVRQLKGEGRPYMVLEERMEILSYIEPVNFIVPFSEESPSHLILDLKPDFHCKGTDYSPESVPERRVVESVGGRVLIVGDPKDHSTTSLLQRIDKK